MLLFVGVSINGNSMVNKHSYSSFKATSGTIQVPFLPCGGCGKWPERKPSFWNWMELVSTSSESSIPSIFWPLIIQNLVLPSVLPPSNCLHGHAIPRPMLAAALAAAPPQRHGWHSTQRPWPWRWHTAIATLRRNEKKETSCRETGHIHAQQ